jgi:hypothetical protein
MKPIAQITKDTGFLARQSLKIITILQEVCIKLNLYRVLYRLELLHFRIFFGISLLKCTQRKYVVAAMDRHFKLLYKNSK